MNDRIDFKGKIVYTDVYRQRHTHPIKDGDVVVTVVGILNSLGFIDTTQYVDLSTNG